MKWLAGAEKLTDSQLNLPHGMENKNEKKELKQKKPM